MQLSRAAPPAPRPHTLRLWSLTSNAAPRRARRDDLIAFPSWSLLQGLFGPIAVQPPAKPAVPEELT
jgi:hypothetical protein